jgi:hypothetical protein
MISQHYTPFWVLLGERAKTHLTRENHKKPLEPKAQIMLCTSFMMSHEIMNPPIKHDIGLHL